MISYSRATESIALSIFLCSLFANANSNSIVTYSHKLPITTALITTSKYMNQNLSWIQLSARDDDAKDCLRSGNCKD